MLTPRLAFGSAAVLALVLGTSGPADAQGTKVFDPVQADSLAGALRTITRDSGNAGIGDVISTLTGIEVATAPLGSPAGGFIYAYDELVGAPIRRSGTFGPHFVERALTTGSGTVSLGLSVLVATYDTVSGQNLDDLRVANFRGSSPVVTSSRLELQLSSQTASLFGSVGITDDFDVAVAVPIVRVDLGAALVQEEGAIGTAILPASLSSTGLGDVAFVGKYRFWKSADEQSGLAVLATLRAPTGDEDNFRGLGTWRTLIGATASADFGRVAVHGSGGYEFWDKSIPLTNTLPDDRVETWFLADQVQCGGAIEFEIDPRLTLSVEAVGRFVRNSGRLEMRTFPASSVPELGIEEVDLLLAGPDRLRKLAVVTGIKWNLASNALLSVGFRMAQADTGLRDKFTPIIGFNWTR